MRTNKKPDQKLPRRRPPATTPEARENQMINLAIDMAEEQLMNRTASSQVVTHFLQRATTKARLEQELLAQEVELKKAKTEAIQSSKRVEELYINALNAMRTYTGSKGADEDA